jgi:hypothetical protein
MEIGKEMVLDRLKCESWMEVFRHCTFDLRWVEPLHPGLMFVAHS